MVPTPVIPSGTRLSHFEILEKLGEGGMGAVYKARDLHLDRLVAIKLLSAGAVSNPERLTRFVREAKAASALNHPNIITVYEIDTSGEAPFIAMEYVDGRTLGRLIPHRGMPLDEALQYAVQIAGALSEAHARGITHRDLKPANVMATEKGVVKVLDFGLAKLAEHAVSSAEIPAGTAAATATMAQVQTEEGVILGTVAYMSPEQAEGKKVDGRSDIFSLGVMLYQMLTGTRPFHGDTKVSTMAAILRQEPTPAGQIVAGLPAEMDRILARCLRKDPARRFQNMADLKVALEELKEESSSGGLTLSTPAAAPARTRRWQAAGALAALLLAVLAAWLLRKPAKPAPLTIVPLTTYAGSELSPSFSPDGSQVAFSWDGEKQDNFDIYIKLVDGGTPVRLTTDPAADTHPAWSPDGRSIAFIRSLGERQAIMLIPSIGGPERKLLEITGGKVAWSPDAKWLAFADGKPRSLYLFSATTGERRRLTAPPPGEGDDEPAFSPDGRRLAFSRYLSDSYDIYYLSLDGELKATGAPVQLTKTGGSSSPVWTADGRELVFAQYANAGNRRLLRMPVTGGTPPTPVVSEGGSDPAISRQGNRMAFVRSVIDINIWRAPARAGKGASPPAALVASTRTDQDAQYSPDGKQIAFISDRSGRPEIWIAGADGTNPIQVTSLNGRLAGSPYWAPDGQRIVFDSRATGTIQVYTIPVSGGKPLQITNSPSDCVIPRYSRDGKWIYFASQRSGRFEVWKAPSQGGPPVQVTRNGGHTAQESPDGAWLYFTRTGGLATESALIKMPSAGGPETQVLPAVYYRGFAPAGKGVYFIGRKGVRSGSIQFLNEATGEVREVQPLTKRLRWYLSVSPDERFVMWSQYDQSGSDLMLIENFR